MRNAFLLWICIMLVMVDTQATYSGTFPDIGYSPPPDWSGPIFQLSQNYPQNLPATGPQPWKAIDFQQNPQAYMESVLNYCLEGNIDVGFIVQSNSVRTWFHAPWLQVGPNGREFVHGLTRERVSRANELSELQTSSYGNFAVGFYNPDGGYVIGNVWANPTQPDPSKAVFPEGTVTFKLLFTTAPTNIVPYLTGSPEWIADINRSQTAAEITNAVRLLQIDIAVKDSRSSCGGWVFGTFQYDAANPETNIWRKLDALALTWGNDPELTPTLYNQGKRPINSWVNPLTPVLAYRLNPPAGINPAPPSTMGWLGRANGPIDNSVSSCLSCHSTAESPALSKVIPSASATDSQKMRWFQDLLPNQALDADATSLDFSLQLSIGIVNEQQGSMEHLAGFSSSDFISNRAPKILDTVLTRNSKGKVQFQYRPTRDPEE